MTGTAPPATPAPPTAPTAPAPPLPAEGARLERRVTLVCAAVVGGLGLATLAAWHSGQLLLARLGESFIPMAPSTALGFLSLACALGLAAGWPPERTWPSRLAAALAFLSALLPAAVLLRFYTGLGADLEAFFVADPALLGTIPTGRMSPVTAACFLLAAYSSFRLAGAPPAGNGRRHAAGFASSLVVVAAAVLLLAYVYRAPLLYGGSVIPVALTTAAAFLVLGVGQVAAVGRDHFPLQGFAGPSARARLMRAFVPLTAVAMLVSGPLYHLLITRSAAHPALLSALLALLFALAVGAVAGKTAQVIGGALDRLDAARRAALETAAAGERELRESHRQLEETLQELRRTQSRVVEQERLAALGQMASGIAHDFNNALAPVQGFAELLLEHPDIDGDPARRREFLELILMGARDAARVVDRLRDFYRKREEGDLRTPLNLNQLVEHAIALARPRWREQSQVEGRMIAVGAELGPVPELLGSEAELRSTLMNLIFNAVDALPTAGGRITLRTRTEGEVAVLEVADSGTGMTEEVRRRCLEPFFTTKGVKGTGLGLAMALGTVNRHQGTIEIESAPGRGTTVRIRLPAAQLPTPGAPLAPAAGPVAPLHILVVDDDALARRVTVECLLVDGHRVETAGDGRAGLICFAAGRHDIVITDHAMPEMNGEDFATEIKRRSPTTPVIFITGFGALSGGAVATPGPADATLAKPIMPADLRRALARIAPQPAERPTPAAEGTAAGGPSAVLGP